MKWKLLFLILCCLVSVRATAQTPATPLVQGTMDESKLVTLHGTVSPLVRTGVDLGAVSNSFAAERLILLLNRPPEREAALQQFLQNAHTRGSASYHKWLTPAQFGAQFGPADSDMQTATGWLGSHGFQVVKTSQSRQFIEFSGTAGQLHEAFHTTIHQYRIAGETHYANAREVAIPAALAPLVRGLAPLNDFRAKPYVKVAGTATYSRSTGKAVPQWTVPNNYGTANPYSYPVTPKDFATQYDLTPLYQAGTNGTGETIGIINESNIDLSLVQDYQNLFGVAGSPPQVVIDGDDPGDLPDVDVEAYLDVELSGAVAPKATVDLYISSGGDLVDPLELAALRAVEDNQAAVLSVSFGNCEYTLGSAGNQFWSALWEQAAAQGQTVLVSAGDTGPECELNDSLSMSGIASTPWNVAMGGTDFYYSDYASGGASMLTLWNTTNDANLGSLKAPLREQPWGDPFGLNVIPNSIERNEFDAGGGGASNCIAVDSTTGACSGGYAKPSWQSGPGVPADKVRDLPDLSLFASNGANLSAYAICSYEGECAPGSGDNAGVDLVGGTSASAPAMAGIIALIDQKYGRQGQANFTFYPLAQQKPTAFHDITVGNNSEICGPTLGPDCALQPNGYDGTPQYPAGPGYDQASGLGSVDAAAMVNDWNSIAFQPTATTLHLSTSSVTHGTPVTITTSVAASSGSGTPTGDVAILTNSTLPASASQTFLSLTNGAGSGSVNYLPGGEYQVTGRYGGDGMFASSTSSPETLTVTPENSDINFLVTSGPTAIATGGTIQYNAPLVLSVQPIGVSAAAGKTDGNATGSAKFTIDSMTATVALNGAGMANWTPPALAIGTHTASANYPGDASFNASSAMPITFSVSKGNTALNMNIIAAQSIIAPVYNIVPGGSLTLVAQVGPGNGILTGVPSPPDTVAPTGTVTVCLVTNPRFDVACPTPTYSQTAALVSTSGAYSLYSSATVTFTNLAAGYYVPGFMYNGDTNWQAGGLVYLTTIAVAPFSPMAASTTTLSISPASISGTQGARFTTTVAGAVGATVAPTGTVSYYDNGNFLVYDFITPASTGATSSATFSLNAASFWNSGANQITAIYSGDAHYAPSTSNVANVTAIQTQVGNFALAPQLSQVTVQAGSSGSVGINLSPIYGFSGAVALTCMPSSSQFSCSVNPTTVTVNGQATAMLTVTAAVQSARNAPPGQRNSDGPEAAGMLVFGFLLACGKAHRKLRHSVLLSLCLVAVMLTVSCGGGGATGKTAPPPPPPGSTPAGTYSVLVTGTANGIVHNAKITVVVP
jgi:subtilase family serine protease